MPQRLRVFMGFDSRQDEVSEVCRFSLSRRSSIPVEIELLRLSELRAAGLYWRPEDPLASTEFTYSRFLVPYLAGYSGWALFCDNDFLWLSDVVELLALADPSMSVQCVQHVYQPIESVKMDGKPQSAYPRKNWSSLMLFNCGHPDIARLTPQAVNSVPASYLHQMRWTDNDSIGALPAEWNWLEGSDERFPGALPKAVHFTRGGPWLNQWRAVRFSELWFAERDALRAECVLTGRDRA
jgi:hypothetical protein